MDPIIEINGKKVLLLKEFITNNELPNPEMADIWVVDHSDEVLVKSFLRKTICSDDMKIYLKPIFLQEELKSRYSHNAEFLGLMCDGYIKELKLNKKATLLTEIENYIELFYEKHKQLKFENKYDLIKQHVFDYYYTRRKKIVPILSVNTFSGYAYPRIASFQYKYKESYQKSRQLLKEMYDEGFLTRKYVDTQHVCHKCEHGFLNYREICPKCQKHNLKGIPLIHHFRCAYVGAESDFRQENGLVCPKCSSILYNIGVDYDKPGVIFNCKNKKCGHEFQNAPIRVGCVYCGTEQYPEELIVKKTYKYKLSEAAVEHFMPK